MALIQQTKNSELLHDIFEKTWHESRPLEVSRAGSTELGKKLSAFNLIWHSDDNEHSVEQIFQSTKTFESGGPFTDIINKKPNVAKKDPIFRESGALKCFMYEGIEYPLEPKGAFYDWLYISALITNPDLAEKVLNYESFTDILFNPDKQVNCQAEACTVYVGLEKSGKLNNAMNSYENFIYTCKKIEP